MRRWILVVIPLALVALVASVAWAASLEEILDDPDQHEGRPARSAGYLVFTENARTFVLPDGGQRIRLNPLGTNSFEASIDGTTVAYEESDRGHADIRFYDVITEDRSDAPDAVNTRVSEFDPALSGDWILFLRTNEDRVGFEDAFIKVMLVNLQTGERRVLFESMRDRHGVGIGEVNGDWATFDACRVDGPFSGSNCQVWRYQISSETLARVPNPGRQQYGGSVTSDGTVYLVRGGLSGRWTCGTRTRIVRAPLGGPSVVIHQLPDGIDAFNTFAFEEAYDSVTLYLERVECDGFAAGIYAVRDADTASL